MVRLGRHAHISPSEFGRLTPMCTRRLNTHINAMIKDEWDGYISLAKMIALTGLRR